MKIEGNWEEKRKWSRKKNMERKDEVEEGGRKWRGEREAGMRKGNRKGRMK